MTQTNPLPWEALVGLQFSLYTAGKEEEDTPPPPPASPKEGEQEGGIRHDVLSAALTVLEQGKEGDNSPPTPPLSQREVDGAPAAPPPSRDEVEGGIRHDALSAALSALEQKKEEQEDADDFVMAPTPPEPTAPAVTQIEEYETYVGLPFEQIKLLAKLAKQVRVQDQHNPFQGYVNSMQGMPKAARGLMNEISISMTKVQLCQFIRTQMLPTLNAMATQLGDAFGSNKRAAIALSPEQEQQLNDLGELQKILASIETASSSAGSSRLHSTLPGGSQFLSEVS